MSKQSNEEIVDTDQKQQPTNYVQQSRSTIVNSSQDARHVHVLRLNSPSIARHPKNELYCSLNSCQLEYLGRLSKGVSIILRMPVENGVLSDEKIVYAVKRIMHALSVIQSGREKSIIDIEMIGKDEIEIIKETLLVSASKRLRLKTSDLEKASEQIIMSKLPEFIFKTNTKYSGFDITIRLMDAVLSGNGINDASHTAFNDHDIANTPSKCCSSPENIKVSFAKYKIRFCEKEISLLEAVEKLRSALKDGKLYCPKTFAADNEDVINGLLGVGLFSSSTRFLLNQVCSYIISGKPESGPGHKTNVTFGKIKKLFRGSYRRHQMVPCDQLCYQDLSTKISNSAKELEPGEDVECLWNEEIALTFKALVTSQFQNICKTTDNPEFQLKWLKKFIDLLATKRQLWPKGTMTPEFLKTKASVLLEVLKTDLTVQPVPVSSDTRTPLTKQELSKLKNYEDLDKPPNAKVAGDNLRFDALSKKCSQKVATGPDDGNSFKSACSSAVEQITPSKCERHPHLGHSRSESPGPSSTITTSSTMSRHRSDESVVGSKDHQKRHNSESSSLSSRKEFSHRSEESRDHHLKHHYSESTNTRSGSRRRRSSRHRSDESLAENRNSSSRSPRRKRYSNESLYEQDRSTKRPKLNDRFIVKKMTDYDKKLQSFQIWDPLRNVTEAKFQDVFKTKEGAPETATFKERATAGSSLVTLDSNTTVGECGEEVIASDIVPTQEEGASTSGIVQEARSSAEKEQHLVCKSRIGDNMSLSTSTDKKCGVLRERYGDITVVTENIDPERVSVIITIQGYVFEGIAATREEAVEEASCKALLLAPFILQKT